MIYKSISFARDSRIWAKIFDAINDAISITNYDGNIILCNKAMEKLVGRPNKVIIDNYCDKLLSQIPHPKKKCSMELSKISKKRESRVIKLGNEWFNCIVDPMLDKNNEIQNFIHIITNITHQGPLEVDVEYYPSA